MPFLSRARFGRIVIVALALAGVTADRAANASMSSTPPVSTEAVHAAFTLNLTRFITWPESAFSAPAAPLVIGTFPRDPINEELDAGARDEAVNGHPVRTMRIQSMDDLAKCHVVFVSRTNPRQAAVLQHVARKPILTIGDGEGFLELGGHVRFVPQPPRIALRISVDNLKASRLEARAQLLRLAAPR
jgi:hypothetical protein